MHRLKSDKGFTLVETLIVVVIMGILITTVTVAVSGSMRQGRISSTTNSLQLFSADMEEVMSQYGILSVEYKGTERSQILEFLNLLETYYLHTYFDKDSLEVHETFFEVYTSTLQDGWDKPFLFRYCFSGTNAGYCLLVSGGDNESVDCASYTNTDFGDDILVAVVPKAV